MKTKARANITVDPDVLEEAKKNLLNISEVAEIALRNKLKIPLEEEEEMTCEKCKRTLSKAHWDGKKLIGDLILWDPYGLWICMSCFRDESVKVSATHKLST